MNKTTERRLKLFDDAGHYGAEILKSPGWVAAVCRTYDQAHCFGRGKPKVVPGTNEIDQACNLRDDEGITPENKARRDSGAPWVKDGLGFDDQPFEAGWCVMGGNPLFEGSTLEWGPGLRPCGSYEHGACYCSAKKAGEQCPYVVLLELDTGKLYISNVQYALYGMMPLGGGWQIADFNCELNGDNEGGVRRRILKDARFAEIMQKAVDASMRGLDGAVNADVRRAAEKPPEFAARRGGMTVLEFAAAVKRLKARPGAALKYKRKGISMPLRRIVEGAGSSMVFVAGGGRTLTLQDVVDYCARVRLTRRNAAERLVEVKFMNSIFGVAGVDKSPYGDIVLRY